MDVLEDIRKKRVDEIQQRFEQQTTQELQKQQVLQQLHQMEQVARSKLTKEALERFGNIKAADPERAGHLAMIISQADKSIITDQELKKLLMIMNSKKDIKIIRK